MRWWPLIAAFAVACGASPMSDQRRIEPFEASDAWTDGRGARPVPEGTVARGRLEADDHLYRGLVGGRPARGFPFPLTRDVLDRGRERYGIYCTPCHDAAGTGRGMVVRRGFNPPPSFMEDRLREVPEGHLFRVISDGFGTMYGYGDRIEPEDRWAIVAHVRALQIAGGASAADLPDTDRKALEALP